MGKTIKVNGVDVTIPDDDEPKKNPFMDENGNIIKINLKPLHDFLLIWCIPTERKVNGLYIPTDAQDEFDKMEGIVIAAGEGYYQGGTFVPMLPEIKPGVKIKFNKNIPFATKVKGVDGKEHLLKQINVRDIWCIVEE